MNASPEAIDPLLEPQDRAVIMTALAGQHHAARRFDWEATPQIALQFVSRPGRAAPLAIPLSLPAGSRLTGRVGGLARQLLDDPGFAGQVVDRYHTYLGVAVLSERPGNAGRQLVGTLAGGKFFRVDHARGGEPTVTTGPPATVCAEAGLRAVLTLVSDAFSYHYDRRIVIGSEPSKHQWRPGFPGRDTTWDDPDKRDVLGLGLVSIPSVPPRSARGMTMTDPWVPVSSRYCTICGGAVGAESVEGTCPRCEQPFSFRPRFTRGDLVQRRYTIDGCLEYGPDGWAYLATDNTHAELRVVLRPVDDRTQAERFVTAIDHPALERVHDVIDHGGQRYEVTEFLGGTTLHELTRRTPDDCVPLPHALAYIHHILPVFSYLHANGWLYTDFSPRNLVQVENKLILTNLMSVRRMVDADSTIHGTIGYLAPEIAHLGPSPETDLYAVGRVLARLSFPFAFTAECRESLPPPDETPLLARFPSYHRFLTRATHVDPVRRFGAAEQMRDHLEDVLLEVTDEPD